MTGIVSLTINDMSNLSDLWWWYDQSN